MWRKLAALPARDRRLLLEAGWRLLAAQVALWLRPRSTRAAVVAGAPQRAPQPGSADRLAWAVRAVARRLPTPWRGCLPQAVAVRAMLARRGLPARLVIGVRRTAAAGPLEAHAWVESDGRVVVGWLADLPSFLPLSATAAGTAPLAGPVSDR